MAPSSRTCSAPAFLLVEKKIDYGPRVHLFWHLFCFLCFYISCFGISAKMALLPSWTLGSMCVGRMNFSWLAGDNYFYTGNEQFCSCCQLIITYSGCYLSRVMLLREMRCHMYSGIVAGPSRFTPHKPPGSDNLLSWTSNQRPRGSRLSSPRMMRRRF